VIATIGVGYADGWHRSHSNLGVAYFDGHTVPLVGRVSMDLTTFDATDQPDCLDPSTGAYTTPRSRVVFVCGARFTSGPYSLAGAAGEILIIHELLHSLGLPENPSTNDAPTSAQITRRVWARCGDARSLAARNRQNWTANRDDETKPSSRIAARPGFLR
jgi:hypothetical protein